MRKKLLMLVMLLTVAVSGAWADEWEIDFVDIGKKYPDKTGVTISSKVATIGGTDMGTCTIGTDVLNSNFVLQTGTTWMSRQANGLYQGNGGGRAMGMLNCTAGQIITIVGTGDPNPTTNVTKSSQNGNTYKYEVTANGNVKFTPARYLYFTKISVEDPAADAHKYTINAVAGGTLLKTIASDDVSEGSTYSAQLSKVIEYEGAYYVLNDGSVSGYTTPTYTMGTSDEVRSINYVLDENIAFFLEGETLGQSTVSTTCSGGAYCNYYAGPYTVSGLSTDCLYRFETEVASRNANSSLELYTTTETVSFAQVPRNCTLGYHELYFIPTEEAVRFGGPYYNDKFQNSLGFDYVLIRKVSEIPDESTAMTRIWDFSQFSSDATEYANLTQPYDYNNLIISMPYRADRDYVTNKGFVCYSAATSEKYFMMYLPAADGTLKVTADCWTDASARITAVATKIVNFTDVNNPPEGVAGCIAGASDGSAVTLSVPVERGKLYYIYFASGAQRITKVTYIPDGAAPMYQSTLDFQSLAAEDVELITEADLTEIVDMTITDAVTASKMVVSGSDTGTPNHFDIQGSGSSEKAVLELNGGTLTFTPQDGRSLKKITIYYDTWDEGNGELIEGESVPLEVDGSKKTAVWSGSSQLVVIGITGKTVIKRIVIEVGERKDAAGIIDIPTGKDIYKEVSAWQEKNPYASGLTINLEENGKYTTSGSLFIGRPLCINGAEGAVIDASKCEDPFVLMRPIGDNASLNAAGGYDVDSIAIKNVTIKGLKNRLVYADRHKYLIGKVLVSNSVIMVDGTTPRSIFDFYCGGNFKELIVENSTLAADPSNSKRGGLLSTQASQSVFALGGENQKISIKNSTLYNIAKGETPVLLERHSDADLTFELLNSIIVNSGEAGKFVLGLNEGQPGEECTWIIGNNSFTFDGKDTGRDEQYGNDDVVEGPITFSGADKGDFSLSVLDAAFEAGIGDPRWLNGAEGDLLVEVASGKDIAAEVAAAKGDKKPLNTLIRLAKDGKYTISGTIESAGNIVIKGDGTGLPTIDATALDAPFVTLDGTETAAKNVDGTENANYKSIGQVKISDLKIEGLSKPLVRDNQKTLVDNLQVQNAVVNMEGSANIFDFNGKGYPAALRVLESTLWSKGGHTGYFLQSSGRVRDLDSDQSQYTQMITVAFSTLYKISVDKQLNNLQGKGQKSLMLMLMNSIIAESTQAGNEVRGWLGGQNSTNPQTIYAFNSYWANGAVQAGWTDSSKQGYDMSETSFKGDPQFKNPAEGDFTLGAGTEQNQYGIGDPRWTVEYVPTAIEAVQTVKENANDGAWYTLQGVRVDKPAKGLYIHNGKKVVMK